MPAPHTPRSPHRAETKGSQGSSRWLAALSGEANAAWAAREANTLCRLPPRAHARATINQQGHDAYIGKQDESKVAHGRAGGLQDGCNTMARSQTSALERRRAAAPRSDELTARRSAVQRASNRRPGGARLHRSRRAARGGPGLACENLAEALGFDPVKKLSRNPGQPSNFAAPESPVSKSRLVCGAAEGPPAALPGSRSARLRGTGSRQSREHAHGSHHSAATDQMDYTRCTRGRGQAKYTPRGTSGCHAFSTPLLMRFAAATILAAHCASSPPPHFSRM